MFPARLTIFFVSLILSIASASIVLSFRKFFFYVPFAGGFGFRETFAFIALLGWIALVVIPPLLLRRIERWSDLKTGLLIGAASLYTLATLAIKVNNTVLYGDPFVLYLVNYPALFFLEWLLPAFYISCALLLRKQAAIEAKAARRSRLGSAMEQPVTRDFEE